ncbi:unnamed protein product [Hydatigera taeniaeformis]|uniref:RRM domain-containing protein n=1 Tax=Hydatigena taeniaeformis TaxID=6205 RepID=A0A0R3WN18_HYDTA|nr:unnamed protein product [Hydatigera taeniaeformis]
MYDVKNGVNFVRYLNTLENMVHTRDGLIIAGTKEVMRFRGTRKPMYLVVYQWMHLDDVECFNREVTPILINSGCACSTRVIFEMDAYCQPFRSQSLGDAKASSLLVLSVHKHSAMFYTLKYNEGHMTGNQYRFPRQAHLTLDCCNERYNDAAQMEVRDVSKISKEEAIVTGDSNASNSTAWVGSRGMYCGTNFNIPKNTSQTMVLIIFNLAENYYGAFRNEMIINLPIFKAYGNGEYLGLSKCVRCVEGSFPMNSGVAALCFDDHEEALRCMQSKTQIREANWMGSPEMYIIPLCNPIRHMADYPFLQVDFYDVKNGVNFTKYMNTVENMVHDKGGLIVAGTTDIMRFRGICRPMYVVIYQWTTIDLVECFNREVEPTLREAGAACSTRVIFEMDAFSPKCLN